jgi:hypothetical protein
MTCIELGPDVRLVKVGDWARASKDPELQPPRDITGRFPKRTAGGLVFLARHTFQGAFTVVGKRFLVGRGKSVHVLDLAGDTPREVASTSEVGVGMIWGYGPKVRIYSREAGTWEIRPGAGQAE